MRIECPLWFVDRSAVTASTTAALEVRHRGLKLPILEGITLLPAKALEETCELHLCQGPKSCYNKEFRVPAGWGELDWVTPEAPYAFNLEAEQVAMEDVFGARCQVVTLRARVVLTNLADCEIEVKKVGKKE